MSQTEPCLFFSVPCKIWSYSLEGETVLVWAGVCVEKKGVNGGCFFCTAAYF